MLLDAIAAYLETQSIGTVGTDIFKGFMPDSPDFCIVLYEYGGQEPERCMNANPGTADFEKPNFQVVVRGAPFDYSTPRTKANDIFKKLDNYNGTLSSVVYHLIKAEASPYALKRDENDRVHVVCDYDAIKAIE